MLSSNRFSGVLIARTINQTHSRSMSHEKCLDRNYSPNWPSVTWQEQSTRVAKMSQIAIWIYKYAYIIFVCTLIFILIKFLWVHLKWFVCYLLSFRRIELVCCAFHRLSAHLHMMSPHLALSLSVSLRVCFFAIFMVTIVQSCPYNIKWINLLKCFS